MPLLLKIRQRLALSFCLLAIIPITTNVRAQEPAAAWMSGEWGIGFRIDADNKSLVNSWNVNALVDQIAGIPGVKYILFNLSDAAHGDAYIAPHSVLSAITPSATPTSPDSDPMNGRDLFMEMAVAFHARDIKVIAYCATQGPAMLKHGAEKAFDAIEVSDGIYTSEAMDNWADYVTQKYGDTSDETYKKAFAEVIVDEYAARYGTLIDGWWFDHSGFANIPLLHQTVKTHNPNTVIAFNSGQKIPLINNNPGYEDYTFGHPTPISLLNSSNVANLPMLTSIEETTEGYFESAGNLSLGHMFIPIQETWNSGALVWTKEQGAEWMARCLRAGGAWTWNVDVTDSESILREDIVALINDILAEFETANGTPHAWLDEHGLVTDDNYEAADVLDFDGDGISNHLEYASGTIPTDTNSLFTITSVTRDEDDFHIEWSSENGQLYTVLMSTSLEEGDWSVLVSGIQGGESTASYTTTVSESKMFFQVMTEPAK